MSNCINSYKRCKNNCSNNSSNNYSNTNYNYSNNYDSNYVCNHVCNDKFRYCLGREAEQVGKVTAGSGTIWPFQNAKLSDTKYSSIRDMDGSFLPPFQNSPFSIPERHITGGCNGYKNRVAPYTFLYGDNYGQLEKATKPSSKDPIY